MKKHYTVADQIPNEEFELVHQDGSIHDTKFETRPIGWLEDSVRRFAKNKASVVAAAIIFILALYAIIVPIASPKAHVSSSLYPTGFRDKEFQTVLPKLFNNANGFWDGTKKTTLAESEYFLYEYTDSNYEHLELISKEEKVTKIGKFEMKQNMYKVRLDTYAVGTKEISMTLDEMNQLIKYETDKGISMTNNPDNAKKSIIKPYVDYDTYVDTVLEPFLVEEGVTNTATTIDNVRKFYQQNPDIYYELVPSKRNGQYVDSTFVARKDTAGNIKPIYLKDGSGNLSYYYKDTSTDEYRVRVDYYDYFVYLNGFKPVFVFGTNSQGQDIFLRLAVGTRFSLLLGVGLSLINFIIGLVYGAISGYYGGTADLIMERVTDIISTVPTIIIMTIAQIQLTNNVELKAKVGPTGVVVLAILIAFVYNGWVGVAGTTRMQFYRFKGQEYVLASRTLGAKDRRLIFKHILPNAAGTLVTSCVLMIPGVIFSESSLSYLGIIDFSTSGISSVGVLLNEGQAAGIANYPHVLLFPALMISFLMISFNLFGNGLRDAFNTTLRGSED